jgi:VanZ family protein
LDTALQPSKHDSAEDVAVGTAGGLVGITLASLARARLRPSREG